MQDLHGHIEAIIGPMYSGKTTELQRIIRRYSLAGKSTILLKHAADTRYEADYVCSHDEVRMKAIPVLSLHLTYIEPYDVIGIDEGQFFRGIANFADDLATKGKIVIIAALSSDFLRKPFPEIAPLLSVAEKIHQLTAVCRLCGQDASFSLRKSVVRDQQLVGGHEMYEACCRKCYNRLYPLFQ